MPIPEKHHHPSYRIPLSAYPQHPSPYDAPSVASSPTSSPTCFPFATSLWHPNNPLSLAKFANYCRSLRYTLENHPEHLQTRRFELECFILLLHTRSILSNSPANTSSTNATTTKLGVNGHVNTKGTTSNPSKPTPQAPQSSRRTPHKPPPFYILARQLLGPCLTVPQLSLLSAPQYLYKKQNNQFT
ncbi:MAG: hypothetical protein Q9218_008279, partial [Villophora microphyllina]